MEDSSQSVEKPVKRKLRWYQFSLRSLLIFVTLFGVACSWLAVKVHQAKQRDHFVDELHKMGFVMKYDFQDLNPFMSDSEADSDSRPTTPKIMRNLLGEHFFNDVILIDGKNVKTDEDLPYLAEFTKLKYLCLTNARMTEARLKYIGGLKQLEEIDLSGSTITDGDLFHFNRLTHLETINLIRTKVTDKGIQSLQRAMPNLEITQ